MHCPKSSYSPAGPKDKTFPGSMKKDEIIKIPRTIVVPATKRVVKTVNVVRTNVTVVGIWIIILFQFFNS